MKLVTYYLEEVIKKGMKQLCVLKKPLQVTFKLQTNIRRRFTENVGIYFLSKLASFTRLVPLLTALKKCEFVTNFEKRSLQISLPSFTTWPHMWPD